MSAAAQGGARTARQQTGDRAEQRALEFLLSQGCKPVARNERARVGEIDLLVRDQHEWVFVEVRQRASFSHGGAAASVGWAKQQRVRKAAATLLLKTFGQRSWPPCRFDVVAFEGKELNWIKNAF